MRNNPVNLFAKSLRGQYLDQVSQFTEQTLNESDLNNNGRIDSDESGRFKQSIDRVFPEQARRTERPENRRRSEKRRSNPRKRGSDHGPDAGPPKSRRPSGRGRPGGRGGGGRGGGPPGR